MAEILKLSATSLPLAPKVQEVRPTGATILVEMLSQQELTSGVIKTVNQNQGDKQGTSNQGYIIGFGPSFPQGTGLAVGQRVLVNGPFIPVPVVDGVSEGRVRGLVEYIAVKAILAEKGVETPKACCGGNKCDTKKEIPASFSGKTEEDDNLKVSNTGPTGVVVPIPPNAKNLLIGDFPMPDPTQAMV